MDGERGDVGRADDAADRQRRAELLATRVELVAEERRRQRRVDEPGGDQVDADRRELEREVLVSAGSAAVSAEIDAKPSAGRRPPVPPMKSSVPPGRTLPAACRATCDRQPEMRLDVAARLVEVELGQRRVVRAAGP